jgi:hypothetical protein
MTAIRSCIWMMALVAVARLFGLPALAQSASNAGASAIDRGTDAYLSGDDTEAESCLAQAIRDDPHDPRPYYLRAVCLLRQNHPVEARADLLIGAELEARANGNEPVGQWLRRLPLADRLAVDELRWRAGNSTAQTDGDAEQVARPIATDAAVLRQKISVRLDQLVQPVSLNELVSASIPQPQAIESDVERAPAGDPFADDRPAASPSKIPSGKLMGIVGRALLKSTPVEALREKMADLPLPGATGAPPAAGPAPAEASAPAAAFDADNAFAPASDDPFAEPSQPPASEQQEQPETPADDEDPFG